MRIELPETQPEVEALRDKLASLARRFELGDVTPKRYARGRQDLLACLGRAKIATVREAGETILAEHHWVEGHARIPDSVLRETAQVAGSLYATDRRLFRWRFQDQSAPSAALVDGVEETFEDRWYKDVASMDVRRLYRWGEALAGAGIGAAALLLGRHLGLTGYVLAGVGLFGILHALLMPTRWIAVTSRREGEEPWAVYAARTKSGRALLEEVERRTRSERG